MMGKGRSRAVETGPSLIVSSNGSLNIPPAPVYYPTEEEFRDPLDYIYKIRPEAEPYGICKIVPPKSWNPPFALDLNSFTFPTKTQAIHQLQARPASCDSKTFELEYNRFLEGHCGRQLKKRVVFEGEELDLCKLFNAVRRFGGYDKVTKEKNWGEVFKFVRSGRKISECAKHVLSQLYKEHLHDYEVYHSRLNQHRMKGSKRGVHEGNISEKRNKLLNSKRRWKNGNPEKVKGCKVEKEDEEEPDQICEQCKSGLHEEVMLLCDRCNKGWHIYCLSPPLKQVPPGNWYCFECLNSDKESFGFVPGKQFALEAFRRVADRAKRKWFGSASASRTQIEKKFWEIIEGSAGEVEVMYGSDLDTSVYGSGFPRPNDQRPESVDVKLWDEYCSSPWNLNNLPKLKGSMLRAVNHNITGVMVPWLYIGMLFSAFCWHFEDHCFYSMNYMHWGEPKCWYSVPGNRADAFEKVMRSCLPDLFDAQPDLLFQLVTMLNPSILCEKGVPVYSLSQEPGNFVVTFPRSYHGGFNLGLNCAEAVNFAPADWLPHGGFGAGLYQLYHKPAVLSHEELLCVVAKLNDWDSGTVPHLKKELERVYVREKTWRERLWRSGIVKSSPMRCRKAPEYVGTEEDPTCVICRQYLYLSAVVCCCRPSTFVCLEHHEHLCECQYCKRRILYRYSLAELSDMVLKVDVCGSEVTTESNGLRRQMISKDSHPLMKKVKGSNVSFSQLAEEWLQHTCKVLQSPFSAEAYATSLKEAEQFLWAGSDVDPVRDMVKTLTKVYDWSKGISDCLSKIEKLTCHPGNKIEKLLLEDVTELLNIDSVPCDEAGYLKLKGCAEEAGKLAQEIDAALSACSKIEDLERLYSRVCSVPVHVKQSEKLLQKISSTKVWKESAREYILDKFPKPVEVSILYKLKSEIMELQVQVPEKELILDLATQAELCQTRCVSILSDAVKMKDVEMLLQEMVDFTVSIPELTLLKQYKADVSIWYARLNKVLLNAHQRLDQQNVINELDNILKVGASLRIQVEELPVVEIELKKALCREKALKAHDTKLSLESIQHLMMKASVLQIEKEKLFVDLSGVVEAAVRWEERAKDILQNKGQMAEFEELIRISDGICAILPSLDEVNKSVSTAKSWLRDSEPFFKSKTSVAFSSHSSPTLEALKELVSQSLSLKILLEEVGMLEVLLTRCSEWACNACSLLHDVECLYDISDIGDGRKNELISRIELLVMSVESITEAGFSFHVDFKEILKLQNASSMLRWCNKVFSFCYSVPSHKEVQSLIQIAGELAITSSSGALLSSLIKGVSWLNEVSELMSTPLNGKKCTLRNAEDILAQYQVINVAFPRMAEKLLDAIRKHRVWREQVNQTFSLTCGERTWSDILQLKERAETFAFSCAERDMIFSEVQRVEHWKQCCCNVVETVTENANLLLVGLQKIKESVDRAFYIYENSRCSEGTGHCIICASHSQDIELLSCSTCQDRYHLLCLRSTLVGTNCPPVDLCPYCQVCLGSHPLGGHSLLRLVGKRPNIRIFEKLLSDSDHLCVRIEERDILQEIVAKAFELKMRLEKIVDFERSYIGENIDVVSKQLSTALKAVEVVGIDDHESYHDLKQALARNSWRFHVRGLLEGLEKPTIQQIQQHLKEGVVINVLQENYFRKRLTVLEETGMQWAEQARKVASDSGALPLHEVFELIAEGKNLPVLVERELESLRARSMLHCICRKPFDERSMVACRRCSEWYHLKCVKLTSPPKFYICAACEPLIKDPGSLLLPMDLDGSQSAKSVEPKTPSPRHSKSRKKAKKAETSLAQKLLVVSDDDNVMSSSCGIDNLWWQTRKPFRRAARKRARFDFTLSFS